VYSQQWNAAVGFVCEWSPSSPAGNCGRLSAGVLVMRLKLWMRSCPRRLAAALYARQGLTLVHSSTFRLNVSAF